PAVGDLWATRRQKSPTAAKSSFTCYEENPAAQGFTEHHQTPLFIPPLVRDQEASSSNLDTPTNGKRPQSLDTLDFAAFAFLLLFCCFEWLCVA
ncbi:MAG: hypothetical protein FWC27_11930, partial [Firmicutes bacterium]|nr:hypothetical protein [Bacillota bacterium]